MHHKIFKLLTMFGFQSQKSQYYDFGFAASMTILAALCPSS